MKELFTFELDLGKGDARPVGEALMDMLYSCLDFCALYDKQPHFYLAGADAERHPEIWNILEVLREENATFSILSEPEQSAFERQKSKDAERKEKITIRADGEAFGAFGHLGNVHDDRLADLWEIAKLEGGKAR